VSFAYKVSSAKQSGYLFKVHLGYFSLGTTDMSDAEGNNLNF